MAQIFKAYDIRGIYPTDLDEGIAYLLGRAFVTYTNVRTVLIGNDMRTSGKSLKEALMRGIIDQGANVVDIGMCSTPMFYFAAKDYPAGMMVTASHNPKEYNGFKMVRENATPIGQGTGMEELKELVLKQQFDEPEKKGTITQKKCREAFVEYCLNTLDAKSNYTVVVDAGNGMGGYIYEEVKKQIPKNITLIPLYWEPDGNFPNHEANPLKHDTLKDLQKAVIDNNADLGLAIDGDGDRSFFIDNEGGIVDAAHAGALIAQLILEENPDATFIYDVNSSKMLRETIKEHGGKSKMSRVGHAFIKRMMRDEDITFGSENSGHMYHSEIEYVENEIIPLCRILNVLDEQKQDFVTMLKPMRKYAKIEETNFELPNRDKIGEILTKAEEIYAERATDISHIDGLRMEFPDWWFCLRASNTEPLLRLNLEADSQRICDEKFAEMKTFIEG